MRDRVPGMSVPDEVVDRMSKAADQRDEGIEICLETIERLRSIEGVHGIHIMAIGWEDIVPEIVDRSGLSQRP